MRNEFQVKEAKKAVKEDDDLAEFDMDGYDDETEGTTDFCVLDSKFQQDLAKRSFDSMNTAAYSVYIWNRAS